VDEGEERLNRRGEGWEEGGSGGVASVKFTKIGWIHFTLVCLRKRALPTKNPGRRPKWRRLIGHISHTCDDLRVWASSSYSETR
jgi:hypothetical protein